MKRVLKYTLEAVDGPQARSMTEEAIILHVHAQRDTICLWALVDTSEPAHHRDFVVHGTGHPVNERIKAYVGTAHLLGGSLVFHVFEVWP